MKPSAAQLRELKRNNKLYPMHLVEIPRADWPRSLSPFSSGCLALAAFRSRSFMLVVWADVNGFTRLSINRTEWDERTQRFRDVISWDDIQRLKAEAGLGDRWAVEVFPPDSEVINVANMRHVWLLDQPPECAWHPRHSEAA